MEYQKIINLWDNTMNQSSKFSMIAVTLDLKHSWLVQIYGIIVMHT